VAVEIFENFANGALETGFPGTGYNGWNLHRGTSLSVIDFGGERVFAGKTADSGSKRMARPLINAGGYGRIEAKWKVGSNVAADYSAANNFYDLGFMIDTTDVTTITGANKRAIMLSYEGAGSNVGIKIWNGTNNVNILTIASVPVGEWLTVTLVADGTGRYTGTVRNAAGDLIANGSRDVPADAGKQLYAFVDFGYTQNTNQNTWGTQLVMKDIIARDDFIRYDEVSQRRNLHFSPVVNGGDVCYVHIPKDWDPAVDNTKVILAGHGYNATIGFTTMLSAPFPDGGYVYGISNTHGNTWGNDQAVSDLDEMRKWIVTYCGGSEKVYTHGSSMGNLVALKYIAKHPEKVRKHVGEIGVCSLKNLYDNATFTGSIQTAYGVTRFKDIPKLHDPIQNPDKFLDTPIMLWVGTTDTTVPHGVNTRPFVDKVSKLGGTVMYIEEPGETHSLDVDPDRYLDFYNASIGLSDKSAARTAIVKLDANSAYEIVTSAPATVSFLLDATQGTLTAISGTRETVKTKGRPTLLLLKVTDAKYDLSNITVTKI
jgi:alpha-beta hydrolase superfamily lysophospholipase